jgi:hypothetical protein
MASDVYTLGKEIYRYILPSLMRHYGKFVAIEPKSKEYFIGNTIAEAIAKAKARFPDREFYVAKIGSPEGVIEKWKR